MDWTSLIPTALTALGALTKNAGRTSTAKAAGKAALQTASNQNQLDQFMAEQDTQNAGQQEAAAQRKAITDTDAANQLISKAINTAGGGAGDPGVIQLLGVIGGKGAYNHAMDIYQGEENARTLRMQASAKTMEGQDAILSAQEKASALEDTASDTNSGDLFQLGASIFSKYGPSFKSSTSNSGASGAAGGSIASDFANA